MELSALPKITGRPARYHVSDAPAAPSLATSIEMRLGHSFSARRVTCSPGISAELWLEAEVIWALIAAGGCLPFARHLVLTRDDRCPFS